MEHALSISVEEPFSVDEGLLLRVARTVLDQELDHAVEMSIVITDEETIRGLNCEFRGYDEPTDVLSFGLSDLAKMAVDDEAEPFRFPEPPDERLRLGEVVISYPTAERQAAEHARPLVEELRHLLIHGSLHLLGYDHAEPGEEAVMRRREQSLMSFG